MFFFKQPQGHEKKEQANYLLYFLPAGRAQRYARESRNRQGREQPQDGTMGCREAAAWALWGTGSGTGSTGFLCILSPELSSGVCWWDPEATRQSHRCGSAEVNSTVALPQVSRCPREATEMWPLERRGPSLSSQSPEGGQEMGVTRGAARRTPCCA